MKATIGRKSSKYYVNYNVQKPPVFRPEVFFLNCIHRHQADGQERYGIEPTVGRKEISKLFPEVLRSGLNAAKLQDLFINTLYVGVVSTVLSLVITVLCAFAFARLEFKGKETLHYTDIDAELYDMENTEVDSVRFILWALTDISRIDALCENYAHIEKVYEAALAANANVRYTNVEG